MVFIGPGLATMLAVYSAHTPTAQTQVGSFSVKTGSEVRISQLLLLLPCESLCSGYDNSLLTDQDMTTTGDNIDYSVPKWKQAMSVNTNPSHSPLLSYFLLSGIPLVFSKADRLRGAAY